MPSKRLISFLSSLLPGPHRHCLVSRSMRAGLCVRVYACGVGVPGAYMRASLCSHVVGSFVAAGAAGEGDPLGGLLPRCCCGGLDHAMDAPAVALHQHSSCQPRAEDAAAARAAKFLRAALSGAGATACSSGSQTARPVCWAVVRFFISGSGVPAGSFC